MRKELRFLCRKEIIEVDNSVSEARDLLAGERSFLTLLRTSITVILATGAMLIAPKSVRWTEWTLSALLVSISIVLTFTALVSYGGLVYHYSIQQRSFHQSAFSLMLILFTLVIGILVSIDAYTITDKFL